MKLDLVDVFGSGPLSGNPLAVVHGADDLDAVQMLALTRWLGFSETTFLLPPTDPAADYRVRIFCPAEELPFAGHPTLGTCHAWLEAGGIPKAQGKMVQECGVGLIEVRQEEGALAFKAPPFTKTGPLSASERNAAISATGVDPSVVLEAVHVANGPKWQLLRLRSEEDVLAAHPAARVVGEIFVGLAAPAASGPDTDGPDTSGYENDWELRAFFSNQHGHLVEDPVTGSFNAGVAMHLFETGLAKGSYRAGQGRMTGANGIVHCAQDGSGDVWIGGSCATVSCGGALAPLG